MGIRRILFVDDEQSILEGLANLLRKHRKRWAMSFALGSEAALRELAQAPVDVVVTDMRMPGMDGAALLRKVKESYPGTARIILSGHAERSSVLAALPVAHQFLSKPCSAEHLTSVIERACRLQALLNNEELQRVVGQLERLPSPPHTYFELMQAASDPDSGVADMASIVGRDVAMSVKVLQLVNSAFFGLAQPVSSVAKGAGYLGADLLKGLALSAHVFSAFEPAGAANDVLARVQGLSLVAGRLAARFVSDKKLAEEALTAALIHDAGMIVLAQALPDTFAATTSAVRASGQPYHLEEERQLGLTHAAIGAYLLGVWGLPFSIVEAVAFHHHPGLVTEGPRETLAAVHVASALVDELELGVRCETRGQWIDRAFLEQAGFGARLPEWLALAATELDEFDAGEAA